MLVSGEARVRNSLHDRERMGKERARGKAERAERKREGGRRER